MLNEPVIRILVKKTLTLCLVFSGFFLTGFAAWTHRWFGDTTVDQALSTLSFSAHGVMQAEPVIIWRFYVWCLFYPLGLSLAYLLLDVLLFHRILRHQWLRIRALFPPLLFIIGISALCNQYQVGRYITQLYHPAASDDVFAALYQDPKAYTYHADHPRNLIMIYVEGLETTYSDPALFGSNLLANLTDLPQPHISFGTFDQVDGTGWTIAGLVGSQCGIPIQELTLFNGNRVGRQLSNYLPSAYCLSDILHDNGYYNVFMKGASLKFSGFNAFLKTHQYDEMYGKEEWLANGEPETNMIGWGLPDDKLFEYAKQKIQHLKQQNKPFNITLLTVDTHGFDGQINQACQKRGVHKFSGIVRCTAEEISDFVHYAEEKHWLEDTIIVIMGDHLAMKNASFHKLKKSPHRHIFNLMVSKFRLHKNTDHVIHFDFFPTILNALGFQYTGDHLGLGFSAVGSVNVAKRDHRNQLLANLNATRSEKYRELWMSRKQ